MARFLTSEWLAEVVSAINGSAEARTDLAGVDITIQQVVDETKYWTKLSSGSIDAAVGEASGADITLTQDYETAVAIARGELIAQAAFMQGKLKVAGNMGKLLKNQEALTAIAPVVASLATEY